MSTHAKYHVELSLIEPHPKDEFDTELEDALNHDPKIDNWFYSKVAGVTYDNDDGTSRQLEIQQCRPLDPLLLLREPTNPVDKKAIAVYRAASKIQLGYLNERLAHEILVRTLKGEEWGALVARARGGTEGQETLGLTILMMKKRSGV